jgi:hypothetical protein
MDNNLIDKNVMFSFPGESKAARVSFFIFPFILFFALPVIFIVNGKPIGIIVGILILSLATLYAIRNVIKRVDFLNESVRVSYLTRHLDLTYTDINRIYFNQEGFLPWHVYVIKFKIKGKTKKATFYCKKKTFDELIPFLKERHVAYSK